MRGDRAVLTSYPRTRNFRSVLFVVFAEHELQAVIATQLEAAQVGYHAL